MLLQYYPPLRLLTVLPVERNTRESFRLGHSLSPNTPSQPTIKILPVNLVAVRSISLQRRTLHLNTSVLPCARPKEVVFKSHSSSVCPPGNPSPRQRFPHRAFQFLRHGLVTPPETDMSGNSSQGSGV